MKNPRKYIRKGYLDALQSIGTPIYAIKVPKNIKPIPKVYILITSQTNNPTATDKDGFEWLCTVTIDINSILEPGYSKLEILDDLEEKINEILVSEIDIPEFINKETIFVDSRDLSDETSSQTIERRIITYQHWVNNAD